MSSPPPKHSLSSPTSGNTPHQVLPTPSSSTTVSARHQPPIRLSASLQQRKELEQQLLEKKKQLQESNNGIGKNVLAKQVDQLQEKLKELETNTNEGPQPTSSVDRLRSLERDLSSYRSYPLSSGISSIRNKEKLLNQRSPNYAMNPTTAGLDPLPSPSTSTLLPPVHGHDSTSLLPLPPPPTGSTPTKRRSKVPNTDRRNTDIEFATEIGQGLLLEVRKMQALLQEKEEKLRTLENQKADLERAAEAMAKQIRQREENEEKLKEETWNLELAKQELVISVTELQSNLSKANAEQSKLATQVNEAQSEIEQLRDIQEKLTNKINDTKQCLELEKKDHAKRIDALTTELVLAKSESRIGIGKHALSSENESSSRRTGPTGEQTDSDHTQSTLAVKNDTSSTSTSVPASPKESPAARNQAMEVETLKTSLAHALRMVSNFRSNFYREKTEKLEFKKLLAESQETIEQLQNDPRMWVDAGPSRSGSTPSSGALVRSEDGQLIGRRPHKASTSTSLKRRAGKKAGRHAAGRINNRASAANDRNSVYSYSSMSCNEESEIDSYDESDVEKSSSTKPVYTGFVPLSSELSQVAQKSVMVDAEMNTDPIDLLPPIVPKSSNEPTVHRSLGDELNLAMSRSPSQETEEDKSSSIKDTAGGLLTGAAAALGISSLMNKKEEGIQISTQTEKDTTTDEEVIKITDSVTIITGEKDTTTDVEDIKKVTDSVTITTGEAEPTIGLEISTQTDEVVAPATVEIFTQTNPEPEKPQVIDTEIQTDSPASIEMLVQTDGAELTEMATQTMGPQLETFNQIAIVHQAPKMVALESSTQESMDIEPEDPSIALAAASAATAAAIAASRLAALEAAVDSFTQSDPVVADTLDQAIQSDELVGTDCGIQSDMVETVDAGIQSEVVATKDADVQYDVTIEAKDVSVQHEEDSDAAALAAAAIGVGADIATETNHISTGTRSDHVETADESTQCESIAGLDREIQYDLMGIDHSTQSILAETIECGVQSEVPATVDVDVQTSVEVAETKDVDVQATAAVPETKDVDIQATAAFAETKDIGVQCEMSDADAIVPLFNNDIDEEYFDTNSKPSSRSTTEIAPTFSTIKPASYRPAVTVGTADTREADNDALNNVGSKDEKLFTKSETDVLIASAVALALANATASKKKQVEEEPMDDPKRHTCDMSLNDQNNNNKARAADSAVASHSSNSIDNDDDVDDDEPMTDADFGNVVVHVPTEQDTITSSLYQATRQQPDQQYKESHVSDPTVFDEVPAPTHPVLAHDYPHQEREITEADVPIRPANPPPTALLNKAGRSPAFTESRSMSPISAHSKGKQPYDPYSDLESQPSHENMHQQQIPHLDKRRSVSISSLSTNNTNEQLHSITSSQYDTSGVRSNSAATTTDPNMINLITQTMIGDFLWKYTRKAVGGGMSERRHQRYFWIHPFTRTLYWSTAAPGLDGGQAKAKTALIENISAIPDVSANASGLPNVSLLIQTSHRQLKLTAPTMEKHDLWFESISYLLSRNGPGGIGLLADKKADHAANTQSFSSGTTGSLLKRPSFRRVHDIFQQPTASTSSMATSAGDDLDDYEDEALEDVRMCCNGKHHVSKLEKDHVHRHHYRKRRSQNRGAIGTIG